MTTDNSVNRDFLINQVLLNESEQYSKEVLDKLSYIKRDKVTHPVITISQNSGSLLVANSNLLDVINNYLTERNIKASVVVVGSNGLCSLETFISIQLPGKTKLLYKNVNDDNIIAVLDGNFNNYIVTDQVFGQYRNKMHEPYENTAYIDEIAYFSHQQRIVLNHCGIIDPTSIDEYLAFGGYKAFIKTLKHYTHEDVCNIVENSKLRGRGGEGFSTGKKWKIALSTQSDQKYLVCNAGETDPGAFMERIFIESDPHKLIEGIAIAAYAIGARKAFIYIESEYDLAVQRLAIAIQKAKEYGILGNDIFGSGYSLDIVIKKGAGAFICGEETALIASIEGRRGHPQPKPPYPATKGLYGFPTVLNNVETLANIPTIIEKGAEWFCSVGNDVSKGTKVFSVSGKVEIVGLVEVEMGTKLRDVIFRTAGGIPNNKKFKAIHIGGPSGGMLGEGQLDSLVDYDSIMLTGTSLGSSGLVVLDEDCCIIDTVKYFMNFLQRESCGICIPCREGTQRMFDILDNISKRPKDENDHSSLLRFKGVMQLENLAEVIKDSSLCGFGRRAAIPVLTSLKWFRHEYEDHIFERNCSAGVCQELKTFEINIETCTGCTLCARKCPTGAIIGTPKNTHFIVQDRCIGCGVCFETCVFNAIISK
ncbi:MAG: NADH-ubiquinone oxidoreductase-F iron-sulfur binding region domain-containing protein [Bacteroidales bacterium]|jgi:NADH:ubiquinone oxidoreductase subunit F (NADH-binding)/Pyruvate/2-oxoacid:ferredoxin oxidoreductase delta subunit|nr:NADH-ubiquinone oxidoreductase-F iron-sulfur binding region domain-containing protein [Bacteroidales bacterium]